MAAGSNFALLETKRGKPNKISRSAEQEICDGPHRFDGSVVNNKVVGYVPVVYEHQVYPRMLYHPKWGMEDTPDMAKFSVGCTTAQQFQAAFQAFQAAEEKWRRSNRTKLAANEEEEKRLLEKGWLQQPPLRAKNKQFDMSSDEI